MPMKTQTALDLLVANPPYGSAGFLTDALADGGEALEVLLADLPEVAPAPEPALSGLDFIQAEFDRLRALPFAESSAGSETNPPVRARDVTLSARIRQRAPHLAAATGIYWPEENRITITADPEATRAEVAATLLHELVHAAREAPIHAVSGRRLVHGPYYRLGLVHAAEQAFDVQLDPRAARWRSWQIDDAIAEALEALGGEWVMAVGS